MRLKSWFAVAVLVAMLMPRFALAEDKGGLTGFIESLQLGWRPEPHETEPFNQPAVMNGYSILNYYQADLILMQRSGGQFGSPSDWTPGPRLLLGRGLSDRDAVEVGYFGLYEMNRSVSSPAPVNVNIGGAIGTGINNRANYRSVMNVAELNLRHWLTPEFSVLAGFRYMNWRENLYAAFDPVSPFAGMALPPGSIHPTYHTSNNLYGVQLGGDWKHCFGERLGIEIGGKAGVFGARTEMDASVNISGQPMLGASAASTRASFIGELGLIGTYKLTTYLNVRAGYQVMWVEGIALAPDQAGSANFLGASSVSNRAGVLVHGAVAGLELRW